MRKCIKRMLFCLVLAVTVWCTALLCDRMTLNSDLIRFHVVANSDSAQDQQIKLEVRDAVIKSLESAMEQMTDVEEAKAYLRENLPKIQAVANEALSAAGFDGEAVVSLCREAFDTRYYDTFTLPAGVYESLRITIGDGAGKNWWCVVFPTLCVPATAVGFQDTAASAGFSQSLSSVLTEKEEYEIRFFLLDALGKLENILFEEEIIPCSLD